jgi:hypothetical protein
MARLDVDALFDIRRVTLTVAPQGYARLDGADPRATVLFEH